MCVDLHQYACAYSYALSSIVYTLFHTGDAGAAEAPANPEGEKQLCSAEAQVSSALSVFLVNAVVELDTYCVHFSCFCLAADQLG